MAAATQIRNSENADVKTFKADTADTIDTIERAIGVIEKGLTGGASMMQFQGVKKLNALLQSHNDDDDVNAPAATVFENSSGSGNIIDSLKWNLGQGQRAVGRCTIHREVICA